MAIEASVSEALALIQHPDRHSCFDPGIVSWESKTARKRKDERNNDSFSSAWVRCCYYMPAGERCLGNMGLDGKSYIVSDSGALALWDFLGRICVPMDWTRLGNSLRQNLSPGLDI